jgi:malonyl-CoA decarboxylase
LLALGEKTQDACNEDEGSLSAFYRIERSLRYALKPMYELLFDRLNTHPGGLKFLTTVRADILSILAEENIAAVRALDSYLKEKLVTWLSPANLELHQITWDDPASLLEKIVAYEAVHPISSLIDLKRRLGVGCRCFGYCIQQYLVSPFLGHRRIVSWFIDSCSPLPNHAGINAAFFRYFPHNCSST